MSKTPQGSDSETEDYGFAQSRAAIILPEITNLSRSYPQSSHLPPTPKTPILQRAKSSDHQALLHRIDALDSKIDRMNKEVREILNMVKAMQAILPRVTSAGAQSHFVQAGSSSSPQTYFMP